MAYPVAKIKAKHDAPIRYCGQEATVYSDSLTVRNMVMIQFSVDWWEEMSVSFMRKHFVVTPIGQPVNKYEEFKKGFVNLHVS